MEVLKIVALVVVVPVVGVVAGGMLLPSRWEVERSKAEATASESRGALTSLSRSAPRGGRQAIVTSLQR